MTVYVDDARREFRTGLFKARWSHLTADTSDELADFAELLGLPAEAVRCPGTAQEHYLVTTVVRARAVRLGAVPVEVRVLAKVFRRKRGKP